MLWRNPRHYFNHHGIHETIDATGPNLNASNEYDGAKVENIDCESIERIVEISAAQAGI